MNGTVRAGDMTRRALAGLLRISEPPAPALLALVEAIGPVAAWEAVRHRDCTVAGAQVIRITEPRVADRSPSQLGDLAERDLAVAEAAGARLIGPGDPSWAAEAFIGLGQVCPHPSAGGAAPLALYMRGRGLPPMNSSVAIVGSRAATPYGIRAATELAADLACAGYTVVSGAAFGIDAAAHRGALHTARPEHDLVSAAVLACGIDRAYPVAHTGLLDAIARTGVVVTEYPPGTTPARHRFLVRNRLIAALAAGTVVVEAGARSGSLNTAAAADVLSRRVMAVPGPITSAVSLGCHELIRNRHAELVTGAGDVLAAVGPLRAERQERPTDEPLLRRPTDGLGLTAGLVYDALPSRGRCTAAELAVDAALPGPAVLGALAVLELEGMVERVEGQWRRST
jgi:DNA processing protein